MTKKFDINKLTVKEKIGQLTMFGSDGTEIKDDTINIIKEYGLGKIIFFDRNVK